jgi:hypothetical protein
MQRRLHLGMATFLAVFLSHASVPTAQAQEISARQLVAARETIRAELATALSHGELTRLDQYRILLHAKEILPPEDVQGLERTMDRLAVRNRSTAVRGVAQAAGQVSDDRATLASYSTGPDGSTNYGELAIAPKPGEPFSAASGNPFREEVSADQGATPTVPGEFPDQKAMTGVDVDSMFQDYEAGLFGGDGSFVENCQSVWEQTWRNLSVFSAVEAFKGPVDLFVPNGNFGVGFGFNAGIPLAYKWGLGVQAGMSTTETDFQGTFSSSSIDTPSSKSRNQMFTTIGLFQRVPFHGTTLLWGFTHDWLQDDYYANMHFAQWRVKLGVEWSPCDETGIWAAMPDHGVSVPISLGPDQPFTTVDFRPMAQGTFYWQHLWSSGLTTTARVGVAQEPCNFLFGGDARIPVCDHLSLIGDFTYIMPRGNGIAGQFDEMWNVMLGFEFIPGGVHHSMGYRFAPVLPVGDNSNFAVRELSN